MNSFFEKYLNNPTVKNEFISYIVSAFFICLSFPPFNLSFLAWVAFFPLFFMFKRDTSKRIILGKSYLFLLIAHVFTLYWICFSTVMGGVLAIAVNPIFMLFPISIWLFFRSKLKSEIQQLLLLGFLWIGFELLLSLWELAFPWMILGNTQYLFYYELQWASIGGIWLISSFVMALNILLYFSLKYYMADQKVKSKSLLNNALTFLVIIFIGGFLLPYTNSTSIGKMTIGIVQPNVDPWTKWESESEVQQVEQMENQTKILTQANKNISLVVWPETSVPFYILEPSGNVFRESLTELSIQNNLAIATGFPHFQVYEDSTTAPPSARYSEWRKKYYHHFNAATVIDQHVEPVPYKKISLVPFAERVPWIDLYPFMKDLRFNLAGLGGWEKGLDTINFTLSENPKAVFPTAICYESAFPELMRSFTGKGATFLTVITNDGWWGNTSGYYQHFEFSRMRAIENHRWVVRSANNGISGFIDQNGNVIQQTDYWVQTQIANEIMLYDNQTLYVRFGDWLPKLFLILSLLFIGWSYFKK